MKKNKNTYRYALCALFCGVSFLCKEACAQDTVSGNKDVAKFAAVLEKMSVMYVDSVDVSAVTETAIRAALKELDPHSTYLNAEESRRFMEPMRGNFSGVGLLFAYDKDTLNVLNITADGPADVAGVKAGDRILKINGTPVSGVKMTMQDASALFRGERGTMLNLSVVRNDVQEERSIDVRRDQVPVRSVESVYMVDDSIGYIAITRFSATTSAEFKGALDWLRMQGMTRLMIDLQGNGGGYLQEAVRIADEFLEKNRLTVYIQGRSGRQDFNSTGNGSFLQGNVVLLVNESSASASEILAGALQDHDRALIIGRRTYGKGLVQQPFNLEDGSLVRITTSRYYTPSGRSIQKPYSHDVDKYNEDRKLRLDSGELTDASKIHLADSTVYRTDNGRALYGGGGIIPDFFVSADTLDYSEKLHDILNTGVINRIAIRYYFAHQQQLRGYAGYEPFIAELNFAPQLITEVKRELEQHGMKVSEQDIKRFSPLLEAHLKGQIARIIYGEGAYIRVMNERNEVYKKAIEVIRNSGSFDCLKNKQEISIK